MCVETYKIAAWSSEARMALCTRDRGICVCGNDCCEGIREDIEKRMRFHEPSYVAQVICSSTGKRWQADHRVALVNANRDDLSLWGLSNLQTLCTECHRRKTREDVRTHREKSKPEPDPFLL